MDSKIIYQEKYKINDLHANANKAGLAMSDILEKVAEMMGEKSLPEAEVVDFANGGHLLSKKLDEVTRSDARSFKSSSAKQAFEVALKTEQLKLSELQQAFVKVLHDRRMQITAYDLKGLTLVVKQEWLSAVIEDHTIRITPGSQRERIYNLVQTAHETLTALQAEIKASKATISPVQLQFKESPDGLIFIPDNENQPSIELQYFSMFPDE